MSVHVVSWALRHSQSKLGDRLVMLTLAEAAHDDGTKAFPAVGTIAVRANLSERQVQRCLRNLVGLGEIEQTGTTKSGTNVYSVTGYIEHEGGDNMSPLEREGGDTHVTGGVTPTSPELSVEPSLEVLAPKNGKAPNPVWDALVSIFGEPSTRKKQVERGKVVKELTAAGATPDEIVRRAKAWPNHYDSATLTPHALDRHWDALGKPPLRRTR